MKVGDEYYYYHNDHLGTPQKMTAENGEVVWSAKYNSFGKTKVDSASTIENNLRFPGQYEDAETKLHYNYHRYYEPGIGRYTTPDPIGFQGGGNFFVYADGDPITLIDPLGQKAIDGINCKEIGRRIIPTLNFRAPYLSNYIGVVNIVTSIIVEDSLSCVCKGIGSDAYDEYYQRAITYEVKYQCGPNKRPKAKIETYNVKPDIKRVYKPTPGSHNVVLKHGVTNGNAFCINPKDQWCSACPNGVGKPF